MELTNKQLLQNWREWEKQKKAFYDKNAESIENGTFKAAVDDHYNKDSFLGVRKTWSSLKIAIKKFEPIYDWYDFSQVAKNRYELPQEELDKIKNAFIEVNTRLFELMKKRANTIKRKRITSGAMPYSDDIHSCIDELMDLFDTYIVDCRKSSEFTRFLLYLDRSIIESEYYGIDEKDFDFKFNKNKYGFIFN